MRSARPRALRRDGAAGKRAAPPRACAGGAEQGAREGKQRVDEREGERRGRGEDARRRLKAWCAHARHARGSGVTPPPPPPPPRAVEDLQASVKELGARLAAATATRDAAATTSAEAAVALDGAQRNVQAVAAGMAGNDAGKTVQEQLMDAQRTLVGANAAAETARMRIEACTRDRDAAASGLAAAAVEARSLTAELAAAETALAAVRALRWAWSCAHE